MKCKIQKDRKLISSLKKPISDFHAVSPFQNQFSTAFIQGQEKY